MSYAKQLYELAHPEEFGCARRRQKSAKMGLFSSSFGTGLDKGADLSHTAFVGGSVAPDTAQQESSMRTKSPVQTPAAKARKAETTKKGRGRSAKDVSASAAVPAEPAPPTKETKETKEETAISAAAAAQGKVQATPKVRRKPTEPSPEVVEADVKGRLEEQAAEIADSTGAPQAPFSSRTLTGLTTSRDKAAVKYALAHYAVDVGKQDGINALKRILRDTLEPCRIANRSKESRWEAVQTAWRALSRIIAEDVIADGGEHVLMLDYILGVTDEDEEDVIDDEEIELEEAGEEVKEAANDLREELGALTVKDLRARAKESGIEVKGMDKNALIEAIVQADLEAGGEAVFEDEDEDKDEEVDEETEGLPVVEYWIQKEDGETWVCFVGGKGALDKGQRSALNVQWDSAAGPQGAWFIHVDDLDAAAEALGAELLKVKKPKA